MKYLSGITCLLLVAVLSLSAISIQLVCAESTSLLKKSSYEPTKTYPGPFGSDLVYYKYPKGNWVRGLNGTFPDAVVCPDALKNLRRTGLWQGHFGRGGSCGSLGEPVDWAVGNRLNFDALAGSAK
jgi:hypothetical protein